MRLIWTPKASPANPWRVVTRLRIAAILLICGHGVMAGAVIAAGSEVVLRLKGSDFTVTGSITAFDGRTYTVATGNLGTVEVDASKFDCLGPCPVAPGASPAGAATARFAANTPLPPSPAVSTPPAAATSPAPVQKIDRRVVISGSEVMGLRLMPELFAGFAASTGGRLTAVSATPQSAKFVLRTAERGETVEIDVRTQGSDQGMRDLERGVAQLVMSTRPIGADESTRLAAAGRGNFRLPSHEHVLAVDGLMVLVAPRNPAVSLSIENLAKILAGEITDWSQAGLPGGKIAVYATAASVDGSDTLTTQLLKPRGLQLTPNARLVATNAELSERVTGDPNALGIGGMTSRPTAKALTVETSCGLIVKPSVFAAKTEEYPLTRVMYLYSAGEPADPTLKAFLAFALSAAAQPIISKLDFVGQDIQALSFADQTDRLAYALNAAAEDFDLKLARTMISDLRTGQRLSTTFRFQAGSDTLTAKSVVELNRLVDFLAAKDNLTKRAQLVGFEDSAGTFSSNLRLSERRTAGVYRTVLALAQGRIDASRITARAYGKLAPVACNDSVTHRALNRRIEVWLQN